MKKLMFCPVTLTSSCKRKVGQSLTVTGPGTETGQNIFFFLPEKYKMNGYFNELVGPGLGLPLNPKCCRIKI